MNLEESNTAPSANENAPAQVRSDGRVRRLWTIVGVVAVLVAIGAFFANRRSAASEAHVETAATPVAVAKVMRTDLVRTAEFDAEFRPYQEIDVHTKVSGFVKDMLVDIGDRVQVGQLLATIEVPELRADIAHAQAVQKRSEADVQRETAASEEAHLAFARLVAVVKVESNLVAQQDVDDMSAKDRVAQASLEEARDAVTVAKADVDKLNDMLAYTRIAAPFAGVITKRDVDPGALMAGGTSGSQTQPLLRLSEIDRLRLMFPVSVSYVAGIHEGQPVEIHIKSMNRTITGAVTRFTHKVDTATRTMEVEVDVPNPDLTLVPGEYASVKLELDRRNKTLAVPVAAISRGENTSVFVLNSQNEIFERIVKLGMETPADIEVLSGVEEGDVIIVGGRGQLQPGQKVEPKFINATVASL